MKSHSALARTVLVLVSLFCLLAVASAADRPVKQNKDYNPMAAAAAAAGATAPFPFVTTGAIAKIKSATIAKDGTITARFTITDSNNAGIDINGVYSPGTTSMRFVAAYIPKGKTQYTAYTTTVLKATSNTNPSQVQASTDSGGKFTLVDALTGTYDYVFATKAPANFDVTATHSIGMQAERSLAAFGFPTTFSSDDVFTFVPDGSAVKVVRDVVNEASCNACHDPISAHGGARKKMLYCVLCHTPQSVNPDTNNTVDMKVFIHKLHMGSSLPSVVAGNKYFVFHRGAVNDYSDIVFPQDARNCTSCHAAGTKQADNWKTQPSREVCGSCHDNVNFATGENHVNLPQVDDNQCKNCHTSQATLDFDASIPGAHVVPNNSAELAGINLKIMKVENNTVGSSPTVTFQVTDNAGNPVDISKLTRFRVILGGPNVDYQTGPGAVMISEDAGVKATGGANGIYTYTMTAKIPAAGAGSYTVSIEARNAVTLMAGTMKATAATDTAKPVQSYFSADKSPLVARRQVVSDAKCGACHQNLTFIHGGNRNGVQECAICHNPSLADGTSKQSVNFATQIHSIHRGDQLANPYILGTTNYQEVRFPGDLRDCATCHLPNTYQVDNVGAQAMVNSPGGFTATTAPISAACLGCHDDKPSAAHALANTSALGESCVTCHGIGNEFAVDVVHARVH
jgi:OmcA/MtrC family decaheme c-type cytochrome